jgi:hypothetical protein
MEFLMLTASLVSSAVVVLFQPILASDPQVVPAWVFSGPVFPLAANETVGPR